MNFVEMSEAETISYSMEEGEDLDLLGNVTPTSPSPHPPPPPPSSVPPPPPPSRGRKRHHPYPRRGGESIPKEGVKEAPTPPQEGVRAFPRKGWGGPPPSKGWW